MSEQTIKRPTLYDLEEDLRDLEAALDSTEGDPEAQRVFLDAYMDLMAGDVSVKLDGYAKLIQEITLRADTRKAEAKRLLDRAKVDDAKVEALKERLRWFFAERKLKSVETTHFRVTLATNGGKLPLEITAAISDLPPAYVREVTTQEIDKDQLRADLEAGQEIPGVRLGERGQSIRIK